MHHPTNMITHTTAFVTPVVERELAQWVHHEGSTRRPIYVSRFPPFHFMIRPVVFTAI